MKNVIIKSIRFLFLVFLALQINGIINIDQVGAYDTKTHMDLTRRAVKFLEDSGEMDQYPGAMEEIKKYTADLTLGTWAEDKSVLFSSVNEEFHCNDTDPINGWQCVVNFACTQEKYHAYCDPLADLWNSETVTIIKEALQTQASHLDNNSNYPLLDDLYLDYLNPLLNKQKFEDVKCRWIRHFYRPTDKQGYNHDVEDLEELAIGCTDETNNITIPSINAEIWAGNLSFNTYSYPNTIQYFKKAYNKNFNLLGKPAQRLETLLNNLDKNERQRMAFYSLGHLLHLIQDMSVPEHTHLEFHTFNNGYEQFVASNLNFDETQQQILVEGLDPLLIEKALNNSDLISYSDLKSYFQQIANISYEKNRFYAFLEDKNKGMLNEMFPGLRSIEGLWETTYYLNSGELNPLALSWSNNEYDRDDEWWQIKAFDINNTTESDNVYYIEDTNLVHPEIYYPNYQDYPLSNNYEFQSCLTQGTCVKNSNNYSLAHLFAEQQIPLAVRSTAGFIKFFWEQTHPAFPQIDFSIRRADISNAAFSSKKILAAASSLLLSANNDFYHLAITQKQDIFNINLNLEGYYLDLEKLETENFVTNEDVTFLEASEENTNPATGQYQYLIKFQNNNPDQNFTYFTFRFIQEDGTAITDPITYSVENDFTRFKNLEEGLQNFNNLDPDQDQNSGFRIQNAALNSGTGGEVHVVAQKEQDLNDNLWTKLYYLQYDPENKFSYPQLIWETKQQKDSQTEYLENLRIVADENNEAHVLFKSATTDGVLQNTLWYLSPNNSEQKISVFNQDSLLNSSEKIIRGADLISDSNNKIFVSWSQDNKLFIAQKKASETSFGEPECLGNGTLPKLRKHHDVLYLFYKTLDFPLLKYREFKNEKWGAEKILYPNLIENDYQVEIDQNGNFHLAWIDTLTQNIHYYNNLEPDFFFELENENSSENYLNMQLDFWGHPHFIWNDNQNFYYQQEKNGLFYQPLPLAEKQKARLNRNGTYLTITESENEVFILNFDQAETDSDRQLFLRLSTGEDYDKALESNPFYLQAATKKEVIPHPESIVCSNENQPVCGVDGYTYSNDCLAQKNQTEVKHEGICNNSAELLSAHAAPPDNYNFGLQPYLHSASYSFSFNVQDFDQPILWQQIVSVVQTDIAQSIGIYNPENKIYFQVGAENQRCLSKTIIQPNKDYRLTVVNDQQFGMKLFVNGIEECSASYVKPQQGADLVFGQYDFSQGSVVPIHGEIKDIRMYKFGLTTEEVQTLYKEITGQDPVSNELNGDLILKMDFEDGFKDLSGNNLEIDYADSETGHYGEQETQVAFIKNNLLSNVAHFNRVNRSQALQVMETGYIYPQENQMSITLWIKPEYSTGQTGCPSGCTEELPGDILQTSAIQIKRNANGSLSCQLQDQKLTSNSRADYNKWTHVACSYDGENLALFVNGVRQDSISVQTNIAQKALFINIGPSGALYRGYMDDIAIYQKALSEGEIGELFNQKIRHVEKIKKALVTSDPQPNAAYQPTASQKTFTGSEYMAHDNFTLNFWLNINNLNQQEYNFRWLAQVGEGLHFYLRRSWNGQPQGYVTQLHGQEKMYLQKAAYGNPYYKTSTLHTFETTENGFANRQWYLVSVSYQNNVRDFYINGQLVSYGHKEYEKGTIGTKISELAGDIVFFEGNKIEEFNWFNRILLPEELQDIYRNGFIKREFETFPQTITVVFDPVQPETKTACSAHFKTGAKADGIYIIDPDGSAGKDPFQVYCDLTSPDGPWTLVARRTSESYVNIDIAQPDSDDILNENTKHIPFSAVQERFEAPDIIKTYSVSGTLANGITDIQAHSANAKNWKLDVKIAPPGTTVDDMDTCKTSELGVTAPTGKENVGFWWQSYDNCSGETGYYGYGHYLGSDNIFFDLKRYSDKTTFKSAELWIKDNVPEEIIWEEEKWIPLDSSWEYIKSQECAPGYGEVDENGIWKVSAINDNGIGSTSHGACGITLKTPLRLSGLKITDVQLTENQECARVIFPDAKLEIWNGLSDLDLEKAFNWYHYPGWYYYPNWFNNGQTKVAELVQSAGTMTSGQELHFDEDEYQVHLGVGSYGSCANKPVSMKILALVREQQTRTDPNEEILSELNTLFAKLENDLNKLHQQHTTAQQTKNQVIINQIRNFLFEKIANWEI